MPRSKKFNYTTTEKRPASGHSVDPLSAWCIPCTATPENGFLRFIRIDKVVTDAVDPQTTDTNDDISSNDDDSTLTENHLTGTKEDIVIKEGKSVPYLFCGKCAKWQLPTERPHTSKYHAKFKASLTAKMGKKHPYFRHLKTYQASKKGTKPKRNTKIIKAETLAKKSKAIGGGGITRAKKNVRAASKTSSKRGKGKSKKDVKLIPETVNVMQDAPRRSNRSTATINYCVDESPEQEKMISGLRKKRGSNKSNHEVSNPKRSRKPLSSAINGCYPDDKSLSSDALSVSSPECEFEG